MINSIIFDAGPIISLTTNNLLWLLNDLKNHYDGEFYIPIHVKEELIDVPLMTKRFKFEALQVMQQIRHDVLKVIKLEEIDKKAFELLTLANNSFKGRNNWIKIVHLGEMQALAAAILLNSDAVVIDERTTRLMMESPLKLTKIWKKRLHVPIETNNDNINKFKNMVKGIKPIRSVELVLRAYELGLLDDFIPNKTSTVPNPRRTLLSSLLWGLKIRGCSLAREEIDQMINEEM